MEKMDKVEEIILSTLFILEEVWGRTYLQKFLFLFDLELNDGDIFKFKKYKYGPFSDSINKTVTKLNETNVILEKPTLTKGYKTGYKYSLTSKGKILGREIYNNKLTSKEKNILVNLNNRFKNYSPTELLKYVYQRYPVFIENSEFKN
jgi:uncharacterized protein YwgA